MIPFNLKCLYLQIVKRVQSIDALRNVEIDITCWPGDVVVAIGIDRVEVQVVIVVQPDILRWKLWLQSDLRSLTFGLRRGWLLLGLLDLWLLLLLLGLVLLG